MLIGLSTKNYCNHKYEKKNSWIKLIILINTIKIKLMNRIKCIQEEKRAVQNSLYRMIYYYHLLRWNYD